MAVLVAQIPVYIWSPEEEGQFQPGRCSRWWLKHTLIEFQKQVAALGSRLVIRRASDSCQALLDVVRETGATCVHFNHLFDPVSMVRDHNVKQALAAEGIACRSFNADLLYDPWEVLDPNDQPYTTFGEFWRR
jgi:cryptochrome 1